jgi:hypothetical protein
LPLRRGAARPLLPWRGAARAAAAIIGFIFTPFITPFWQNKA